MLRRNNDELVATYGNAVHRTLTFLQSKFGGVVPEPRELNEADRAILAEVERGYKQVAHSIEQCHLKDGLQAAMVVARAANRYLDEQAPWKQIKVDREAAGTTIYVMLQVLSALRILFCPYLPFSSQKLHEYLGFTGDVSKQAWRQEGVAANATLPKPAPLFPKLESDQAEVAVS
jgi:methionyl-tRNA synthetase